MIYSKFNVNTENLTIFREYHAPCTLITQKTKNRATRTALNADAAGMLLHIIHGDMLINSVGVSSGNLHCQLSLII
jgi:hypothetical protein